MKFDQETISRQNWELVRKYAEAKRQGFYVEALVLFNYMLRHNLLIIINDQLVKDNKEFKEKYLSQETNELANTAKNIGAIQEELRKDIDRYFSDFRSAVVHGMLKAEISYEQIGQNMDSTLNLLQRTQEKIIGKWVCEEVKGSNEKQFELPPIGSTTKIKTLR